MAVLSPRVPFLLAERLIVSATVCVCVCGGAVSVISPPGPQKSLQSFLEKKKTKLNSFIEIKYTYHTSHPIKVFCLSEDSQLFPKSVL